LLTDVLKLWDEIHENWPGFYNAGAEEEAGCRGRFDKLTAILKASERFPFKGKTVDFRMPEAYEYPILSALRAAVKLQGREAKWNSDPVEMLRENGHKLTTIVGNIVRNTNDPNNVRKDVWTWSSCFLVIESALSGTKTVEAKKKFQGCKITVSASQEFPKARLNSRGVTAALRKRFLLKSKRKNGSAIFTICEPLDLSSLCASGSREPADPANRRFRTSTHLSGNGVTQELGCQVLIGRIMSS